MMRFDMHCHTKEGSLDGKISLRDYVLRMKILGYDGMVITDHNSYKAWRWYTRNADDPVFQDFTILKGIEYDTSDGGHILVIMPKDVNIPLLEVRGMPVRVLIELVHAFHGILGPAHPTGEKYLSLTNCKYYHKHPEVIADFDFIETYNSCITDEANKKAAALAEQYGLPCTAGSDAHKLDCIGCAYTDFDQPIHSEDDLIKCIKNSPAAAMDCGGSHYPGTSRDHLGIFYDFILRLYNLYTIFNNMRRRAKWVRALAALISESTGLFDFLQNLQEGRFQELVQLVQSNRPLINREVKRLHLVEKVSAIIAEPQEKVVETAEKESDEKTEQLNSAVS